MLRERLLTAGVLIALFLALILFLPPAAICGVVVLLVLAASWEYAELTASKQNWADRGLVLALSSLIPIAAFTGRVPFLAGSLFLPVLALAGRYVLTGGRDLVHRFDRFLRSLFGIYYVGFGLSHFVLLTNLEDWKHWILSILAVTYLGDGAAYLVGSTLGRTKLSPLLSPKKTVEGALGGLAGSLVAFAVCRILFFPGWPLGRVIGIALLLAASGQAGDLLESLVKRSVGAKDSGTWLPGHGGILDRIDSILLSGPVGYYLAIAISTA